MVIRTHIRTLTVTRIMAIHTAMATIRITVASTAVGAGVVTVVVGAAMVEATMAAADMVTAAVDTAGAVGIAAAEADSTVVVVPAAVAVTANR